MWWELLYWVQLQSYPSILHLDTDGKRRLNKNITRKEYFFPQSLSGSWPSVAGWLPQTDVAYINNLQWVSISLVSHYPSTPPKFLSSIKFCEKKFHTLLTFWVNEYIILLTWIFHLLASSDANYFKISQLLIPVYTLLHFIDSHHILPSSLCLQPEEL